MATFLPIGSRWINLDLVSAIDQVTNLRDGATTLALTIHYTIGSSHFAVTLSSPADVQMLMDWLKAHKAS